MDKKIICKICNEDTTKYFNIKLVAEDGEVIKICDTCFQDVSVIDVKDNFKVYVNINGKKYYEVKTSS